MPVQQLVAVVGRGVVEPGAAVVTADDVGFTRGDGVFDATRVVTANDGSSTVDHLEAHLDRFGRSLAGLDHDFSQDERSRWHRAITQAVEAWTVPGESILKIMWSRGQESDPGPATEVLTITEISAQAMADREGIAAVLLARGTSSDVDREVPWLLGGVKSLSYAINMAAKREAVRRGAREVVFTTTDGYCLEGPNAALIAWIDGVLTTTPVEGTGILRSITQTVIFEAAREAGVPTSVRLMRPAEVKEADGAWLVSSVRGAAPITRLDDRELRQDVGMTRTLRHWAGFGD